MNDSLREKIEKILSWPETPELRRKWAMALAEDYPLLPALLEIAERLVAERPSLYEVRNNSSIFGIPDEGGHCEPMWAMCIFRNGRYHIHARFDEHNLLVEAWPVIEL